MKPKRRLLLIASTVALAIVGLIAWLSFRYEQLYNVTVLPTLGGSITRPVTINDIGQVVGFTGNTGSRYHIFLWDRENGMKDLGPGFSVDINNAGQIAGTTTDPNGNKQAFFWDPKDVKQMLGTLDKTQSVALALNNHGQVVGNLYSRLNLPQGTLLSKGQAFIWEKRDGMRKLFPHKQRESLATSINDTSQIIGSVAIGQGGQKHCFWDSTEAAISPTLPLLPPIDFPVMDYDPDAIDLNNKGCVLGKMYRLDEDGSWDRDRPWIFLWTKESGIEGIEYLFPLEQSVSSPRFNPSRSNPLRFNDANQILYSETHTSSLERISRKYFGPYTLHCLWDPKRGKIVLDRQVPRELGKLVNIVDINNHGCIAGVIQTMYLGQELAVLLEPIPERWGKRRRAN